MKKLLIIIPTLILFFTSCHKTDNENPQPIPTGHTKQLHYFEIVGETPSSQVIYHDSSFQAQQTGELPNFWLSCGDSLQFLAKPNQYNPSLNITIYMDGKVLKQWVNYTDNVKIVYNYITD